MRVLYISDVPVNKSSGGSLLLYRIFEYFKKNVIFGVVPKSRDQAVSDLPIKFEPPVNIYCSRFLSRRYFVGFGWILNLIVIRFQAWKYDSSIQTFKPNLILSVSHGITWFAAYYAAKKNKIPYYLICHDDIFETAFRYERNFFLGLFTRFSYIVLDKFVGNVIRGAAEIYCVSGGMIQHYESKYGRRGKLLQPTYGTDSPQLVQRISSVNYPNNPVGVFVGNCAVMGNRDLLIKIAIILKPLSGKLLVFGKEFSNDPALIIYDLNTVFQNYGYKDKEFICSEIANKAHFLFLPASFSEFEKVPSKILFPSKLVDYLSFGVPVLVWGGPDNSIVSWSKDNPTSCCFIDKDDPKLVSNLVVKLSMDYNYSVSLVRNAEKSREDFSPAKQFSVLPF